MPFPEKLPIERVEDYHTHYLGNTLDNKLFWGYQTFVYPIPFAEIKDRDPLSLRREYAVLHFFDNEGNYLLTKSFYGGRTRECNEKELAAKIDNWMDELGEVEYCDIEIKLFQTFIDGFIFGLIPDEEFESISLQPSSTISFQAPWNGEYFT